MSDARSALPSADEFFGSAQPGTELPTADEFFAPQQGRVARGIAALHEAIPSAPHVLEAMGQGAADAWGSTPPVLSPEAEKGLRDAGIFNDYADGHTSLMKSINEAFMRPAASAIDLIMRGSNAAFGAYQTGMQQLGTEFGSPALGRDLAAIPESRFGSPFHEHALKPGGAFERAPSAASLANAALIDAEARRRLAPPLLGTSDADWKAGADIAEAPHEPGAVTEPTPPPIPDQTPPAPDIHAVAREIAPETFGGRQGFDALMAQRETFNRWLADLAETRRAEAEANAPHAEEIADLQGKIEDATPRLAKKYQARLDEIMPARDEAVAAALTRDTPDMARIRAELQKTDYQMRDLAPQVGAAYREAQARLPSEPGPETPPEPARAPVAAEPAQAPAAIPEAAPAPAPATTQPVEPPRPAFDIAADTTRKLVAVGRPLDEAEASATVVKSMYDAYAKRFNGARGTAEELYAREAPEIRTGRAARVSEKISERELAQDFNEEPIKVDIGLRPILGELIAPEKAAKARAEHAGQIDGAAWIEGRLKKLDEIEGTLRDELKGLDTFSASLPWTANARRIRVIDQLLRNVDAERGALGLEKIDREYPRSTSYYQVQRGSIAIRDGRNVIRLFKDADASTFMHETGHDWLERMVRDAKDEAAPADLVSDAGTVRKWLGAEGESPITRAQHEKFARGFERYLMEGVAPSKGLASVFAQFKAWLTQIYETVSRLRSPINDEIRGVFDRLVAAPEHEPVIAPERSSPNRAAEHERLAEETPPEQASTVADQIRAEADAALFAKARAIHDEIGGRASEAGRDESEGQKSDRGGNAGQPQARGAGGGEGRGTVGKGGGESAEEGGGLQPAGTEPERSPTPNTASGTVSRVRDKAGNIWLDPINAIEDAKAVIRQLAAENMDFHDARYGDPSWELYHRIKAAGELLAQSATATADAFAKFKETGTPEDALKYNISAQRTLVAAEARAELTAGWGRAGHAFQRVDRIAGAAARDPQAVVDFIKRTTGKTLFQLRDEGELFNQLETPDQQAKFLFDSRASRWQKVRGGILSYFINNLISGPVTHLGYSIGNTSWAMFKATAVTGAAATVGAIRELATGPFEGRVHYNEVGAQLYGILRGARDGLAGAGKALGSGVPFMKGANLTEMADLAKDLETAKGDRAEALQARLTALTEAHEENRSLAGRTGTEGVREQQIFPNTPGLRQAGRVLEFPSRSVSAIHTLFYSIGYEQEIAARAYRAANDAGLTGDAHSGFVAEYSANPPAKDIAEAHTEALKMVLMRRPKFDSFQGNLSRAINSNIAAKIVMPFMQIGANILREGLVEATPIGLLTHDVRDNIAGKNGAAAQQMQAGKIVAGTAAAATVIGLTAEGVLTDSGPTDPNERRLKQEQGWAPDSIKVGNYYIPYRKYLGPLGPLIAATSNLYTVGHLLGEGKLTEAASHTMFGFTAVVADETWMQGLTNFVDAARHWDTDGERYLRNLAVDFLPFAVGVSQVAHLIDPYQREVHSMTDAVRAHEPIASEGLYPVRSATTGEPVESHMMMAARPINDDPILAALARNSIFPAKVERKILGVPLTDKQYDDYARIAGRLQMMSLKSEGVDKPAFANLPAFAQEEIIKKSIDKARNTAATIVKSQSYGTADDIVARAVDARKAYAEGGKIAKSAALAK